MVVKHFRRENKREDFKVPYFYLYTSTSIFLIILLLNMFILYYSNNNSIIFLYLFLFISILYLYFLLTLLRTETENYPLWCEITKLIFFEVIRVVRTTVEAVENDNDHPLTI